MQWRAHALQIGRRRIHAQLQVADPARHQRLVPDGAAAYHAVDVFADHVDHAVAGAHVEHDIGIQGVKLRQRRHQQHAGKRTGHIYPQMTTGQCRSAGQAGFHLFQCGQHFDDALVVRGAVGRDIDLARGTVQQLEAQPRLQLLHQLGHRGAAHVQRLCRLRKTARIDHAHKRRHGIESVHITSAGYCLDYTNSLAQTCLFICRQCALTVWSCAAAGCLSTGATP